MTRRGRPLTRFHTAVGTTGHLDLRIDDEGGVRRGHPLDALCGGERLGPAAVAGSDIVHASAIRLASMASATGQGDGRVPAGTGPVTTRESTVASPDRVCAWHAPIRPSPMMPIRKRMLLRP